MVEHRDKQWFEPACEKRPAEELYDLQKDPDQRHNIAADPAHVHTKKDLESSLMAELKATGDPRILGGGDAFDSDPYYGSRQPKTR